jgi:hypothetical protein
LKNFSDYQCFYSFFISHFVITFGLKTKENQYPVPVNLMFQ